MVTKVDAARIATSAGIPMLLTSLEDSDKSLSGQDFGTHFHAQASKNNITSFVVGTCNKVTWKVSS
jgi:glutamate 5-kinase